MAIFYLYKLRPRNDVKSVSSTSLGHKSGQNIDAWSKYFCELFLNGGAPPITKKVTTPSTTGTIP